jgi:hypothetical protein
MADPTPPTASSASIPPPTPPRKRRKWVRRVVYIAVALVVVVVALAAMGPTIASTGAVRSVVLAQVNKEFLSGRIEIADWNFGWFSTQTIRGIKVYDDKQALVADVPSVTVDTTLASAVANTFSFGKTRIEKPNLNIRQHTDGTWNVESVARRSDGTTEPLDLSKPIDIPNFVGEIEIVDGAATFSGQPGVPAIVVSRLNGTIKIPGGDAPVTNAFELTTFVGDGSGGQVTVNGTIGVIKNGQLVVNETNVKQDLTVTDIPVDAVQAFLPPELLNKITGRASGSATLAVIDGRQATVTGRFTVAGLSAGGPVLNDDTLSTETTELTLPTITVAMPNGPTDINAMRVTTGAADQPIQLAVDQGKATVFVDAPLGAILKLLDGHAPGDTGTAVVAAKFDAGKIVPQLPNTLKLVEGVSLTGGTLDSTTTVNLTPAAVAVMSSTSLTGVAGRNTVRNTPVALKPIKIDVAGSTADITNPLVSLRDVKLDLASGFANGSCSGPTLAGINGQIDGTLDALQAEAGQVIDFGEVRISGAFNATVGTSGDLSKTLTEPAVLTAGLSVRNLNVSGVGTEPIQEPQIKGDLTAAILTGEDGLPVSVDVTKATLDASNAGTFTVAADATARIVRNGQAIDLPSFAVSRFALNVPRAINLAGAVVPMMRQFGQGLTGELRATLNGSASDLLGSPGLSLAAMDVAHSEGLIGAKVTKPLAISLEKGNTIPQGSGEIQWSADLAKLTPVIRNLLNESASTVDVRTGRVAGTLAFNRASGATATSVVLDGQTTATELAAADGAAQIPPITFGVTATAADDLSTITVDRANATGDLFTASLTKALVRLNDPANPEQKLDPLKMIESADASLSIPNLQPVFAIASSFLPALSAPATPAKPGDAPTEPLAVTGGSFSTKATISRGADGLANVNVSEIAGENIRATMAGSTYEIASVGGSQTLLPGAGGTTLSPKGKITINGVRMSDRFGKVLFAEEAVEIANHLVVDVDRMDAVINVLTLNTVSSGAVALSMKGAVRDFMNARQFESVVVDVTYDPAPLAQLAKPFIATDPNALLADLTAGGGKVTKQWVIGGSLPADKPFNEAIRSLTARGGIELPSATVQGNSVQNVNLTVDLANGIARVGSPKPAMFNGGELNLDGTTVDLTDIAAPRLSMPRGLALVQNAAVNPYLINNTLGKVNPMFSQAVTAEGLLNVTVVDFDRVPLGSLLTSNASQNDGQAELSYNIRDMKLGNPLVSTILRATGNRATLDGEVRDSTLKLQRGVATTNVTYAAIQGDRQYPLRIAGDVGLSSFNIGQMSLTVLTEFVQGRGGDIEKYMPAELVVPVTGAVDSPNVDLAGAIQRNLTEAAKKAAEQQIKDKLLKGTDLGKILGGDKDKKPPADTKAVPKPGDSKVKDEQKVEEAVGDALKDLFNRKKKDKK